MRSTLTPAVVAVSLLVLAACDGSDRSANAGTSATTTDPSATSAPPSAPPTTAPATTDAPPPSSTPSAETDSTVDAGAVDETNADTEAMVETAIGSLAKAYARTEGAWAGFVTAEHPAVIVVKNAAGEHVATVALNHPAPDALGDATERATDGLPFRSLHRVSNPVDTEYYEGLEAFDFHARLGGVDSFAMIAGGPDAFFDPTQPDWASTWVHELFHRYQDEAFAPGHVGQDVEGYDYSADNLRLAALEERALAAALRAETDDARRDAARHFVGLRLARLAADARVALDGSQERIEGTARFLEHRFAGDDTGYVFHAGNYDRDLEIGFDTGTKEHYGFGRFYGTGSAVLQLSILSGVGADDLATRVEAGETPAEVLADVLGVTGADAAALVAAAETAYDPDGALVEQAEAAAARVPEEPPVFGDDGGETGGDGVDGDAVDDERSDGEGDGEGIVLTADDTACLTDAGVDLANDSVIPDEAVEACLAGTP